MREIKLGEPFVAEIRDRDRKEKPLLVRTTMDFLAVATAAIRNPEAAWLIVERHDSGAAFDIDLLPSSQKPNGAISESRSEASKRAWETIRANRAKRNQ